MRHRDKQQPADDKDADAAATSSASGPITRHIILVRHGQYDETHPDDARRILTPLGRDQARMTGRRVAHMMTNTEQLSGRITIKALHSSDMARAKETADLMVEEIETLTQTKVNRTAPDPNLNEGVPCHVIPSRKPMKSKNMHKDSVRIETAFRKHFHRAPPAPAGTDGSSGNKGAASGSAPGTATKDTRVPSITTPQSTSTAPAPAPASASAPAPAPSPPPPQHEFEVIVCQGNVIRYFAMRSLQLPPEAWLRLCTFNCSLTYLTVRPNGRVSCRSIGDVGHLDMAHTTFSGHHGLNW